MAYGAILGQSPNQNTVILSSNNLQTLGGQSVNNQINLSVNNQDPSIQSVRNIYAGTSDIEAGTTSLSTGLIYFVYE